MNTNTTYDFDLLVIGAGSAGARATRLACERGLNVCVVEDGMFGGTCVNVGCVPKKLFSFAGEYGCAIRDAQGYGWHASTPDFPTPDFQWNTLRDNKDTIVNGINSKVADILTTKGATVINGRATFLNAQSVRVDAKDGSTHTYTAQRFLIATGCTPWVPSIPGIEHAISSFDAFYFDTLPKRIVVVGSGYIGVEFASIFQNLGVHVDLVIRKNAILSFLDKEVCIFATAEMEKTGMTIHKNTNITEITKNGNVYTCHTDTDNTIQTDCVFYATGRRPNLAPLALDTTGVKTENGAIVVNESYQTNIPHIYAVGDVLNRAQLTPIAIREAVAFISHTYDNATHIKIDYDKIPTAVFCFPNIGTVGLSEQEATAQGYTVDIYATTSRGIKNAMANNGRDTLLKLVVDTKTDTVLGVHMVGEYAGEIIQALGVAITAGATKADFDNTIAIHPTMAEEFVTMTSPVRTVSPQ